MPDTGEGDAAETPDAGFRRPPVRTSTLAYAPTRFSNPLAVAVSPLGNREVYFSAFQPSGDPAIFEAPLGQQPIARGPPLELPVGLAVSADGLKLFVADLAAGTQGALLEVTIATGNVRVLYDQGELLDPSAVAWDAANDRLLIAGTSVATGIGGIWGWREGEMTPIEIPTGAADLRDPSGLDVGPTGSIYVYDTLAADQLGRVWRFTPDGVDLLASGLAVGFPSGISVADDEEFVLVSTTTAVPPGGDFIHAILGRQNTRRALQLGLRFREPLVIRQVTGMNRWIVADGPRGAIYSLE